MMNFSFELETGVFDGVLDHSAGVADRRLIASEMTRFCSSTVHSQSSSAQETAPPPIGLLKAKPGLSL